MLLSDKHFKDIMRTPRPLRVTQAMLDALYGVHIAPIEATADVEHLIEVFNKEIAKYGGSLFQRLQGLKGVDVAKLFMLKDATSSAVYTQRAAQIRNLYEESGGVLLHWASSSSFCRLNAK